MVDYVPLLVEGIHKSKIPSIKSFANRHGAKLIEGSIRPEESEGNYFSAEIIAKRGYKEEVIKGILGPGYAKEVFSVDENSLNDDYKADIIGD
jgi:hypothetical protein